MAKSRRKQIICKRKLGKAKKQRQQKLELAKLKAEVKGYLAESDRLMNEAESLFRLAVIEKDQQPKPGFNIPISFGMRMFYEALQNDMEFKSAFYNPPADWCPPFIKATIYTDSQVYFAQQWLHYRSFSSWRNSYSATLKLYHCLIGSKEDRWLCGECARFDWRYHLVGFEGGSPLNWVEGSVSETAEDTRVITRSNLGGEYELRSYATSFTLPSLANALENEKSCTLCSMLVSAVRARATTEQIEHIAEDAQPIEIKCYSPFNNDTQDSSVLHVRFCSNEQVAVGTWDVINLKFALLTTPDCLSCDPMVNRALDTAGRNTIPSTQIDFNVVRSWWQRCKGEHLQCRKRSKDVLSDPTSMTAVFRLIDVEKNSVIIAPKACAYVTLSYVWGGIDAYQSTKCKKTSDVLTGDEIIPINRRRLPKTVRNAMQVIELIGERYLWVDALCIVQDDDLEKAMTISRMDKIYRNSLLTIVAADGRDANSGLTGLEAGSRLIQSVVGCVDNIYLTLAEPAPELNHSLWSSRAWTYQEEQFSQRMLIFAHDRIYYKCSDGSFGEARPLQRLQSSILSAELEPKVVQISEEEDQVLYSYTQHVEPTQAATSLMKWTSSTHLKA